MKIPILSRLFKSRADPKNTFWQNAQAFFFGPATSGKTVNENTAMTTSAAYACLRILSETIASLPLHVYYLLQPLNFLLFPISQDNCGCRRYL